MSKVPLTLSIQLLHALVFSISYQTSHVKQRNKKYQMQNLYICKDG